MVCAAAGCSCESTLLIHSLPCFTDNDSFSFLLSITGPTLISDSSKRLCLRLIRQTLGPIPPTSKPIPWSTDTSPFLFSWLLPADWSTLLSPDRRLEGRTRLMRRGCNARGESWTRLGPRSTRSGRQTFLGPLSRPRRSSPTSRPGRSSCSSAVSAVIYFRALTPTNAHAIDNIIREALKQRLDKFGLITDRSLETPSHDYRGIIQRLYSIAQSKCHFLVRTVGTIIKQHLGTSFFQYDAFQIRDGVFFAGLLLANDGIGSTEDINLCISALREMRWAYSKSEEREQSIRMVWQAKGSGSRHEPNPIIPSSYPPSYPAPSVGHYTRPAMLPRVEVPVLTSVSSGSSSDEPHWPASAVSNSDASSPGSLRHGLRSPHISGTPPLPATSEGYPTPTHYVPQSEVSYFDPFTTYSHPPTGKGSPFEPEASPTVYYSQEYSNPAVPNFFSDSSLPPIPGASASYPTTQFYYSGN